MRRRFRTLCHHIQIATSTRSRKFVTQTVVMYHPDNRFHTRRIGSCIETLVQFPALAYQTTHFIKVSTLYSFIHIECMSLHLSQQAEMFGRIQEHASHTFCQNTFGCRVIPV